MSRNFELMQQLELDSSAESREVSKPGLRALDDLVLGTGGNAWAGDEALSVVQRIFLPQTDQSPRMVVFAGIDHGDGCTGISASVAETLANNGYGPVCIVEANFRSPALPALFGVNNHHGLADALRREGPIRSYSKAVGTEGLWLISCGGSATHGPNLLSSERIEPRLNELRKEFSFVIIDAPPLSRYADAVAIGRLADGVVLVLGAATTRRESAQVATSMLRSAKVPILGAVLNKRTYPIPEKLYKRL